MISPITMIWLSHIIQKNTPLYGGATDLKIEKDKKIKEGDSCNSTSIAMSLHTGTHVDVPYHFVETGKCIDDYEPQSWIYNHPVILNIKKIQPGRVIGREILRHLTIEDGFDTDVDLVILNTDFECYRSDEVYWRKGPGLSPQLAGEFKKVFPNIRAIGMNFISISSLAHRTTGRLAHKAFLEKDILIFEDMHLADLTPEMELKSVIALPLRFSRSEGAPCSILGFPM